MKMRVTALLVCLTLVFGLMFTGCTGKENEAAGNEQTEETVKENAVESGTEGAVESEAGVAEEDRVTSGSDTSVADASGSKEDDAIYTEPSSGDYLEIALNVYYNDTVHSYFQNEAGRSIFVKEEGTYTLSFDTAGDLSEEAETAGITQLKNLTAIYILDMGVAKGKQSALKACDISYDKVTVNGTDLTVTKPGPKSAFKGTGIFDTNDPINGWDGSAVDEAVSDSNHAANFTTITDPTRIDVTFTLSNMKWTEEKAVSEEEKAKNVSEQSSGDTAGFINTSVFSTIDFTDMNAVEFSKYLGNGINLGNTFEACNRPIGTKASVRTYETLWGQPVTTAEMFKGMKNCGFDSVRIPVSWTNMMDYENGDYTIPEAFLDRVEEVVNYALDAEMFVILNDHWDSGWWARFGSATPETVESAWKIYDSIWRTVAERFKDYSDMLIFESANEELGDGLNKNADWKDSGSLSENMRYEMLTRINQRFIDIVRSSGGNNTDRFLLLAGYNTDITKTCDSRFTMPEDTVPGKLLLSVHYYTPWNYCGSEKQAKWGTKADVEDMNRLLKMMTKYTDMGYGIYIGEYAALPIYDSSTGKHTLKDNTVEFTTNFLNNCDKYGFANALWSTNDFFNRKTCHMISTELEDLFTSRCFAKEQAAGSAYMQEVEKRLADTLANAPKMWDNVETYEPGTPVAWIMWNGGAGTYSVGDTFNPADNTAGIKATNTVIEGSGEYTVRLDFATPNDGITFAALGIADGELLFPKGVVIIEELRVNDEKIELTAFPYTSSDDGKCTRVNLYNAWVSKAPDDARIMAGSLNKASAIVVDPAQLVGVKSISIRFRYIV